MRSPCVGGRTPCSWGIVVRSTLTIGTRLTLADSATGEIGAVAGSDGVVAEFEHSLLELETIGDPVRAIDLFGVSPLVRLTSNHSDQIKHMMDNDAL